MTVTADNKYNAGYNSAIQHQHASGLQGKLDAQPLSSAVIAELTKNIPTLDNYKAAGKLQGKFALITGGDTVLGKAVAALFAMEGANVAISYLKSEEKDAQEAKNLVEKQQKKCVLIPADLSQGEKVCKEVVQKAYEAFGHIDILVNNAAVQPEYLNINEFSEDQMEKTFKVNVIPMFHITKAALQYLKPGSSIINTIATVNNSQKGQENLLDFSATKGAILAFTKSLSLQLIQNGIKVNAVAPGIIWAPYSSNLNDEASKKAALTVPMQRPAQPVECATAYVFLASNDSSYFTGQTLQPNGGALIGA